MLKELLNPTQRPPTVAIEQGDWFDILLFDIRLQFKLPKLPVEKRPNPDSQYADRRPFVNTISKQHYLCIDTYKRYDITIYTRRWLLSPAGLFSKPDAQIKFWLSGLSATKPQIKKGIDLTNKAQCKRWIDHYKTHCPDFFGGFVLENQNNGYYKLVDTPAATKKHNCNVIQLNGRYAYSASNGCDHREYWLPFSPSDLVHFNFTIKLTRQVDDARKQQIIDYCNTLTQEMMSTVTLIYPEKTLPPHLGIR